jgi:hypothetical protein
MYLAWQSNAKELKIYVQHGQQPSKRVRLCLEINNFKSYKATKIEPEKEWKCKGWPISGDGESHVVAHTKQCIQKGFEISDSVTNK